MRAFITGDIFCDDGDFILRLEEKQSGLKTRYACSRTHERVNTAALGSTGIAVDLENYPRTTMCLGFGREFGMYGMSGLQEAPAEFKAVGKTDGL